MENFSLTLSTFPSGVFAPVRGGDSIITWKPEQVDFGSTLICNPGLLEKYRKEYTKTPVAELSAQIAQKLEVAKKVVVETGIEDYSRGVTELSLDLQTTKSDCYLAPLRGARFPALFIQVMTNRVQFECFDYKQGADRVNSGEERLRNDVKAIIGAKNREKEEFRVTVVDVVKGGYGIPALVDLLEEIKNDNARYVNQRWFIDLRMLHSTALTALFRPLDTRTRSRFDVTRKYYRVSDTVVEDFDEALGFVIRGIAGEDYLKPASVGGQFLYKCRDGTFIVESSDLFVTLQELVADKLTENLTYDLNYQQIGDLWKNYVEKG